MKEKESDIKKEILEARKQAKEVMKFIEKIGRDIFSKFPVVNELYVKNVINTKEGKKWVENNKEKIEDYFNEIDRYFTDKLYKYERGTYKLLIEIKNKLSILYNLLYR